MQRGKITNECTRVQVQVTMSHTHTQKVQAKRSEIGDMAYCDVKD